MVKLILTSLYMYAELLNTSAQANLSWKGTAQGIQHRMVLVVNFFVVLKLHVLFFVLLLIYET